MSARRAQQVLFFAAEAAAAVVLEVTAAADLLAHRDERRQVGRRCRRHLELVALLALGKYSNEKKIISFKDQN